MSKILTIGRDTQCDICLNDSTDVVSRRHAVLECVGGKYYLTDQSRNGTYINGMKMTRGERVPVTRRDVISFAHVCNLDWSLVPQSSNTLLYGVIALGVIAVLAVVAVVLHGSSGTPQTGVYGGGGGGAVPVTGVVAPDEQAAAADDVTISAPVTDSTTTVADPTVPTETADSVANSAAATATAVVEPKPVTPEQPAVVEQPAEKKAPAAKPTPAPKKTPVQEESSDDEVIDAIY